MQTQRSGEKDGAEQQAASAQANLPRPQSAQAAARTQRNHQSIPLSLICHLTGGEVEEGGWLRLEGRLGWGGLGWAGEAWRDGSVKGLLSHSQSARKKKKESRQRAASTQTVAVNGQKDQIERSGKAADGVRMMRVS